MVYAQRCRHKEHGCGVFMEERAETPNGVTNLQVAVRGFVGLETVPFINGAEMVRLESVRGVR